MPDVEITYNNNTIASLSGSGTEVLETNGKLCSDDITVVYTRANGSASTPATTITVNPTISVSSGGLITASVSGSQSVTPTVSAGYVSTGTAGTITVNGSNTQQLTTQAAQTITPTTSNQTISSGTFLTGNQTILGDTNLVASNIMSGVSIFGVTGTLEPGGNLESFTISESTLYSQSVAFNAQQGYLIGSYKGAGTGNNQTINIEAQNIVLGDNYHINGTINAMQGSNSESITLNTDFIMPNSATSIDFTYTGSDLIEITIQRYSNTIFQIQFTRKNISSPITIEKDIELLKYGKGFNTVNLNLIDNPQALDAFRKIAMNNTYLYPSDVGCQIIFNSQTSIASGAYAYRWFASDQSYYFNNTTYIGTSAFYGIKSPYNGAFFSFPEVSYLGNGAFQTAYAISGIYAPKCTTIDGSCFQSCNKLREVNFPSVISIWNNAFAYCSNLSIANFSNCNMIGFMAFYSCSKLNSISFPNCTSVNSSAFEYCSSLTEINFPKVTIIGNSAFEYCLNMISATFPECTEINYCAFHACFRLYDINFPKVTIIGNTAFANCSSLSNISFSVCTTIGSKAFTACSNLVSISFPQCSIIYGNAFQACFNLSNIYIPNCESIGQWAFSSCSNIVSMNLSQCSIISSGAFSSCINLQWVSFPKCTSIGNYAFSGCSKLESLYLLGSSVATLGTDAFNQTPMMASTFLSPSRWGSIFVPSSLLTAYKTATNWVYYSNRIVGV